LGETGGTEKKDREQPPLSHIRRGKGMAEIRKKKKKRRLRRSTQNETPKSSKKWPQRKRVVLFPTRPTKEGGTE